LIWGLHLVTAHEACSRPLRCVRRRVRALSRRRAGSVVVARTGCVLVLPVRTERGRRDAGLSSVGAVTPGLSTAIIRWC